MDAATLFRNQLWSHIAPKKDEPKKKEKMTKKNRKTKVPKVKTKDEQKGTEEYNVKGQRNAKTKRQNYSKIKSNATTPTLQNKSGSASPAKKPKIEKGRWKNESKDKEEASRPEVGEYGSPAVAKRKRRSGPQTRSELRQRSVLINDIPRSLTRGVLRKLFEFLGSAVEDVRVSRLHSYARVVFTTADLAKAAARLSSVEFEGKKLQLLYQGRTEVSLKVSELLRKVHAARAAEGMDEETESQWIGSCMEPVLWDPDYLLKNPVKKVLEGYAKTRHYSEEEVDVYREDHQIEVLNCDPTPNPAIKFQDMNFGKEVLKWLTDQFQKPTPVQAQIWPIIAAGRDCIAIAETGSGKTLGYLLPAVAHIMANGGPGKDPKVLVTGPTRELVMQITQEFLKIQNAAHIRIGTAFGGQDKIASLNKQGVILMQGVDVVVAVPGRIIDFVEAKIVSFQQVTYFVLDECDNMLQQDFVFPLKAILSQLRPDRQTLMFSATFVKEARAMAPLFLNEPAILLVGGEKPRPVRSVQQNIVIVEGHDKKDAKCKEILHQLFSSTKGSCRVLLFVQSVKMVNAIAAELRRSFATVVQLHSGISQADRIAFLKALRNDNRAIMVCTELASRGLDVPEVRCVMIYDMPYTIERYIHCIGRTGRAGKQGISYAFFDPKRDTAILPELLECFVATDQVPSEELMQFAKKRAHRIEKRKINQKIYHHWTWKHGRYW